MGLISMLVRASIFLGVVERFCNELSGAFGDLARTLDRAFPCILAGSSRTFANVLSRANRMQRHQITGPLADALGSIACAFAGTFADVTAATCQYCRRRFVLEMGTRAWIGSSGSVWPALESGEDSGRKRRVQKPAAPEAAMR
jgi:hypothetical protein